MSHDLFLRACRGEAVERTPIWIMRQAGRYLPEYRAVRERVDFLTLCRTPELAAEVTLQPIDRLGVDAAILFSDILIPAAALGISVEFDPGPVIDRPLRDAAAIGKLRGADPREATPYVYDALRILRRELAGRVPLIGFAAAPFTLAVYLVEGGGSKQFEQIKGLLHGDPAVAHRLLQRVTETTMAYVTAQVEAGAQAIQLFDTWAGILSPETYGEFALRYAEMTLQALRATGVPTIYFALNANHLLEQVGSCGADVLGIDWRTPLDAASRAVQDRFVLQGNLDPCLLLTTPAAIEAATRRVLEQARSIPGHVFNLGHGILPGTPVEHAQLLVSTVRSLSRR